GQFPVLSSRFPVSHCGLQPGAWGRFGVNDAGGRLLPGAKIIQIVRDGDEHEGKHGHIIQQPDHRDEVGNGINRAYEVNQRGEAEDRRALWNLPVGAGSPGPQHSDQGLEALPVLAEGGALALRLARSLRNQPGRLPWFLHVGSRAALGCSKITCVSRVQHSHLWLRLPQGALLNPLLEPFTLENSLHVDAGGVNFVGGKLANFHQLLDLGDGDAGSRGHHRIKVPCRLAVHKIAPAVALPGLDQGAIGRQAALHNAGPPIEVADLLAFGHDGSIAGGSKEGRNAGTAGANALCKRALRVQLEVKFTLQHQLFQQLVLAHVGADVLSDLTAPEQLPQAELVHPGVVADGREVLDSLPNQGGNEILGNATQTEAADHDGGAILDVADSLVGTGNDLVHSCCSRAGELAILPQRLEETSTKETPRQGGIQKTRGGCLSETSGSGERKLTC